MEVVREYPTDERTAAARTGLVGPAGVPGGVAGMSNGLIQMVDDSRCNKTFSLVFKPATIRAVLSLAVSRKSPIHQLDVKNAFLNGNLSETVYMHQPPGFTDPQHPNPVCLLQHSLYGLKQAPRAWFQRFAGYAIRAGFITVTAILLFLFTDRGGNFLSWTSKRQHTISHSSAEAKYRGVANTACLRNLLRELHSPLSTTTLVYCDNVSAVYLSANPVQHQRTKHIKIDIHFICDMVQTGHIWVLHVPSRYQYADIFTKGLPTALFEYFRSSLSVWLPPAQTARAY
nr:ribonuclease H-like domain-containing protein [Tanacetum cinerariifolium]